MRTAAASDRASGGVAEDRGTEAALLDVAERLFAEEGVEKVALTRIVAESAQRNRSAVHYHFGSRDGVVAAVLNRRLSTINAIRRDMIDELARTTTGPSVRAIVGAAIAPLGQVLIEEPWGRAYVQVLAQVTFSPNLLDVQELAKTNLSGLAMVRGMAAVALPDLPRPLLVERFEWLNDSVVFAMARWTRNNAPGPDARRSMAELVDRLIQFGEGELTAPASTASTP